MKIAIDAGHGINTAGKQTPDGIKEWTLNNIVADYLIEYLKGYAETFRTDDTSGKTDIKLTARRNNAVNNGANLLISIHHNALSGKWNEATGVEVYRHNIYSHKEAKDLTSKLVEAISKETGLKNRGAKKANFTVIATNKIPCVLCEGGFMDGQKDSQYIRTTEGQKAYARAIANTIISYYNLKKSSTTKTTKYINNSRVQSWQTVMNKVYKCGLAVDSNFGPDCEKKANKYQLYKKKLIALRIRNDYVKWLQNRLKELGYKISVDGSFWNDTDKIVRQFQKDRSLKVDGYVGANTVKELLK